MRAAAFTVLLLPIKNYGEDLLQPFWVEQPRFQIAGHQIVELFHRHSHTLAGGWSLSGFHRAGIVTITSALTRADGHGSAAPGTMDEAGEHGRTADDAGRHNLGIAGPEHCLHGVEGFPPDDRRYGNCHDLTGRFQFLGLGTLVELMLANIGAARQDAVDLPDTPAPAATRVDVVPVEIGDDVLDTHLTAGAIAFQRQAIDHADRVGVEGIDFELLLGLGPTLLGGNGAIADRGCGAIPEPLSGILLQGPHDMLGIFFGLILIEQRHDLPHHDVHGVVAHLLCDRDELHAVLRQLPDIELQFEVIAEEAREAVNHHNVEGGRFARACLDHLLELWAAVVGRRSARLDEGFDKLVAA